MISKASARMISFPLIAVALVGCQKRNFNAKVKDSGGSAASTAGTGFQSPVGSAVFNEMADFRADPRNRLNYSPMTPCDLFVWAESVWPTMPIDANEMAAAYKATTASGAKIYDYTELKAPAAGVATKTKVPMDKAVQIVNGYLNFKDPAGDAHLEEFIHSTWIQSIINHGRGWSGSTGYKGDSIERVAGSQFSAAALQECRAYANNIQGGGGNSAMHMVGDYIANVYAGDFLAANPDAKYGKKNAEWAKVLIASEASKKIPYFSLTFGAPPPKAISDAATPGAYDISVDPRRFVVPNISYRTFKAIWGDSSMAKVKQDLSLKAYCYFKKNRQADYRNEKIPSDWESGKTGTSSNWIGSWSENGVEAFDNFEGVEKSMRTTDCTGVDFTKPF